MILCYDGEEDIFYFECQYHERAVPKGAGFRWNKEKFRWETKDKDTAVNLFEFANEHVYDLLLEHHEEQAYLATIAYEQSQATDAEIEIPCPEGLSYMPFQRAGIAYALQRDKTLIADEMGLGKTIQALGYINASPVIEKFLIVCPAVVKINWYRECRKWLLRGLRVQILNPGDRFNPNVNGYIVNYDLLTGKTIDKPLSEHRIKCPFCKYPIDFQREGNLKVCIHYVESSQYDKKTPGRFTRAHDVQHHCEMNFHRFPELHRTKWDLLIADEVHYAKNKKALRSQALYKISDRAHKVLFLTGTPIINRPGELYPILTRLGLRMTYTAFMDRYAEGTQTRYGYKADGASNLDELQVMLRQRFMVRRLKADVLTDLPAKMRQVVELDPAHYADVLEMERQISLKHEKALAEYEALIKRAQDEGDTDAYKEQIKKLNEHNFVGFADMARVRRETAVAKIKDSIEFIKEALESVDKLIVFAHHKEVLHAIHGHFKNEAVIITGDTSQERRQEYVDAFQKDSRIRLFVGSIQACGVGITLTAASNVLFLELDWTPANMTQAEDRAHRIGQKDCVNVSYLVVDGSLDAKLAKTIIRKEAIIRQALDGAPLLQAVSPPQSPARPIPPPEGESRVLGLPCESQGVKNGNSLSYTESNRAIIHSALRMIASTCDFAHQKDGLGFNKLDAEFGHNLCALPGLTSMQAHYARKLVIKYGGQLPEDVLKTIKEIKGEL